MHSNMIISVNYTMNVIILLEYFFAMYLNHNKLLLSQLTRQQYVNPRQSLTFRRALHKILLPRRLESARSPFCAVVGESMEKGGR